LLQFIQRKCDDHQRNDKPWGGVDEDDEGREEEEDILGHVGELGRDGDVQIINVDRKANHDAPCGGERRRKREEGGGIRKAKGNEEKNEEKRGIFRRRERKREERRGIPIGVVSKNAIFARRRVERRPWWKF